MKKKNPAPKNATKNPLPEVTITHRQRDGRYDRTTAEAILAAALPHCVALAFEKRGPLARLDTIEISVVGRRKMAAVHREFLGIFGATDVITFPYGEIIVCAPVAFERAAEFGHSPTEELALYMIHGLLHLAGLDDISPADAAEMEETQHRILHRSLPK